MPRFFARIFFWKWESDGNFHDMDRGLTFLGFNPRLGGRVVIASRRDA